MTEKKGLFSRLKEGLAKTRENLAGKIEKLVKGRKIDEELYEELEEILIGADVGVKTTLAILEEVRDEAKAQKYTEGEQIQKALKEKISEVFPLEAPKLNRAVSGPTVYLVVGVNGAGKTTTIGKLAAKLRSEGKKVVLGAADTFRAAAIDQLEIWADRSQAELIRHQEGADPAAVTFDACQAARSRKADYLIVDTAGRLHTKVNLMEELKKVRRVVEKELPGAPHEVILVLDSTTGQNAVNQAKLFSEAVECTAIALTKLDGTAKGGVVVAIASEVGIPVKLVGIGEKVDDLKEFDPQSFVEALFATGS